MDAAVINALKKKQELERELAKVNQFLALYGEFSGTNPEDFDVHHSVDKSGTDDERELPLETESKRNFGEMMRRKLKQRGRPADFGRLMEAVLKDEQRPMQRGELVTELERRGHQIPSSDKARYLGTILWRHQKTFESVEGRGYWLKGVPLPAST